MDNNYKAVIFDMDGTILDTIEDLKDALNHSLARFGHKGDYTTRETYAFFGSGARAAVTRALLAESAARQLLAKPGAPDESGHPVSDEEIDKILAYYKPYYAAHCAIKTGPFPGIPALLRALRERGVRTAVVSNKPADAVQSLCHDYFPGCFDHIAGETDAIPRKPAPDMVISALGALGAGPEEAVYIGDSEVDVQTAKNAGLACICVDWGFRSRRQLLAAGADTIVSSCEELMRYL